MNFLSDILPLIFALAIVILVLYLSFIFTKFIGKKMNNYSKFNNIKIIEQVALGQDKSLIITEVCGKFYLIGTSSQSIEILSELTDNDIKKEEINPKNDFLHILNNVMKSKKESSGNDNDEK